MNRDDHWVRFLWIIVGLLDGCGAIVQQLPILPSCQFPVPGNREFFNRMCRPYTQLPFMCDIHGQLEPRVVPLVAEVYARHRAAFKTDNGTDLFGIALVRQLSQPSSTLFVTPESDEFKCIFAPPCHGINNDQVERFVDNFKYFTKVYTSVLFRRWFPEITCPRPRILALVLTEGVINDPRKLTTVVIYTQEAKLRPFLANIQFEITNSLLHGNPLHEALADLINQIGYAVREYYATNGTPRHHGIPLWAFQLTAVSVALVIVAMIVECQCMLDISFAVDFCFFLLFVAFVLVIQSGLAMAVVTDEVQLKIRASFLELLEFGQFIRSDERPINGIDGLTWQLVIYPNGEKNENFGYFQAYVILSKGGFETSVEICIKDSDLKHQFKVVQADAGRIRHPMIIFNGDIHSSGCIKDEEFLVEAKIEIKKPLQMPNPIGNEAPAIRTFEDTFTLTLDPEMLCLNETGVPMIMDSQRNNGITWNVVYFPNGEYPEETDHVKVRIIISGGPAIITWTAGLAIGSSTIYTGDTIELTGEDGTGACVATHYQCKIANKVAGNIEIVVNVKFSKDANYITYRDKGQHAVSDAIHMEFPSGLFDLDYNGQFESSDNKLLPTPNCTCSQKNAKHTWRIRYFFAGEDEEDKGHLTLYIDVDNPKLEPISVKGTITIDGMIDAQPYTFEFQQQKSQSFLIKRLVSINDMRVKGALEGMDVGINCDATFETH